eukprot:TRINITY_DN7051_c0_g1_i1.p1 TRINITY_DN7051_c0_g1~~TRINITY_DN7051_c0_g1_i1.p1  ORF type:complete len:266 (+),score=82.36 TRINITY_DN7051_c0_g1_i1:67-864(+)
MSGEEGLPALSMSLEGADAEQWLEQLPTDIGAASMGTEWLDGGLSGLDGSAAASVDVPDYASPCSPGLLTFSCDLTDLDDRADADDPSVEEQIEFSIRSRYTSVDMLCKRLHTPLRWSGRHPHFCVDMDARRAVRLECAFVYGSLSPSSEVDFFAASFMRGLQARKAVLRQYKLRGPASVPFIKVPDVEAGENDTVEGWLVACPDNPVLWASKVSFADKVARKESEQMETHAQYTRAGVWVSLVDPQAGEPAHVFALVYACVDGE